MQCSAMKYFAIPCNIFDYNTIPCNPMLYNETPSNTMQLLIRVVSVGEKLQKYLQRTPLIVSPACLHRYYMYEVFPLVLCGKLQTKASLIANKGTLKRTYFGPKRCQLLCLS